MPCRHILMSSERDILLAKARLDGGAPWQLAPKAIEWAFTCFYQPLALEILIDFNRFQCIPSG